MESQTNSYDSTTRLESQGLSDGGIIGIVVAVLVVLVITVLVTVLCIYRRSKDKGPVYASGNGMNPQQPAMFPERSSFTHTTQAERSKSHFPGLSDWSSDSAAGPSEITNAMPERVIASHKKGLDNLAFCEDEAQSVRPKVQSSQQVQSTLERRKNRMDSNLAAVIAAERDKNTSVFSIYNTDDLNNSDAVIVSDQRTAL